MKSWGIPLGAIPKAIEDRITNGCGPDGLAWLIPNWNFEPVCRWHDLQWNAGGTLKDLNRSNWGFLIRGTALLLASPERFNRKYYQVLYVYYKALCEVGEEWWDFRDTPRTAGEVVDAFHRGELGELRNARSELLKRVESRVRGRVSSKLPGVPHTRTVSGANTSPDPDRLP